LEKCDFSLGLKQEFESSYVESA